MAADTLAVTRILDHLVDLKNSDKRDNTLIRLSGAGQCSRQLAYRVVDTPRLPESLTNLATFQIGHAYHEMAQRWLMAMGWTTPDLVELSLRDEKLRIKGTTDGVSVRMNADWKPDEKGTRRIFEIKSMTDFPKEHFGKPLKGSFSRLEKPRDYHLDQANSYGVLWNKLVDKLIDQAYLQRSSGKLAYDDRFLGPFEAPYDYVTHVTLIYMAKDGDGEHVPFKVFTQPLSDRRWTRLEAKFGRIWEALDQGELPERDYDPFGQFTPCKFCEYKPYCVLGITDENATESLFGEEETGNSDWSTLGLPALDEKRD